MTSGYCGGPDAVARVRSCGHRLHGAESMGLDKALAEEGVLVDLGQRALPVTPSAKRRRLLRPSRLRGASARRCEARGVHDRLGERAGRLLGQVVPDAAGEIAVRVLA